MTAAGRPSLLGVILAGGEGRRMHGADKGLQLVGDTRLVALVLAAVAPQVDAVMISANRNIDTYAALAPTRQDRCTGFAGPMAGIEVALDMAADRWLATVPVDCPTPPADLVARLCDALRQNPLARCAAVFDGERVQPLFALYREGLGDAARRALRDNTGPHRWQSEIGRALVDFSDCRDAFRNLNSRAELDDFKH